MLAAARSPVPLARSMRFAPPGAGSGGALLLELVEAPPPSTEAAVDVSDASGGSGGASAALHRVARLAVRDVPADAAALVVSLSVDAAGGVELRCEAEAAAAAAAGGMGAAGAGAEEGGARTLLASVRA